MSYRIEAVDDSGAVIHRFNSLREASRAGFSLSRLNKALTMGQRHRGYFWRRVDGLNGLSLYLAAHQCGSNRSVPGREIYDAYLAVLPESERNITFADFTREARRWIDNVFSGKQGEDEYYTRFAVHPDALRNVG